MLAVSRTRTVIAQVVFALGILLILTCTEVAPQLSFGDPDLARMVEGTPTTPHTAQYLIHRAVFARQAIQLGRFLFHQDFAERTNSGCNGIPCDLPNPSATWSPPWSKFEASSCATCHSVPRNSAGFGPKTRDTFTAGNRIRTPDLFGAGLVQQLAAEASEDLALAKATSRPLVTANGVRYDTGLGVRMGGSVNPDLIVRPFGRKGVESHIRAFASRAAWLHLGLQAQDRFQCPNGDRNGDGRCDGLVSVGLDPDGDGVADELTQGGLSLLENMLVNYPIPGRGPITAEVRRGERIFHAINCTECHVPEMRVRQDPRIEHLTVFWNEQTNRFEAERRFLFDLIDDGYVDPDRQRPMPLAVPRRQPFVVPLYSDLKRHEMGPHMADVSDEEGIARSVFLTRPLWGVGSYTAFLHDGSARTLQEAIMRHGGEAIQSRKKFAQLRHRDKQAVVAFLKSLILFSVEDILTAKIPITRSDVP